MHHNELEIEKQFILSDEFLSEVIGIPSIHELHHFNPRSLPTNPYFAKYIFQDMISYEKDSNGTISLSRVRHEIDRQGKEQFLLGFKHGNYQGMIEKEVNISQEELDLLLQTKQTHLLHIEKLRYWFPISKTPYSLEIDIFTQKLAGMHVAEIEFPNSCAMNAFELPNYIIQDITHIGLFCEETVEYFSHKHHTDYSQFIK